MQNYAYGDRRTHMGIPVCIRTGIAKIFTYGDPRSHNEIVRILGATYASSSLVEDGGTTAPTALSSLAATAAPMETSTAVANAPPLLTMTPPTTTPPTPTATTSFVKLNLI
jgi:hypothetical protein